MNRAKMAIVAGFVFAAAASALALDASTASAQAKYTSARGTLAGVSVEANGNIQGIALRVSGAMMSYLPCTTTRMADHPELLIGFQSGVSVDLSLSGKCFTRITVNH